MPSLELFEQLDLAIDRILAGRNAEAPEDLAAIALDLRKIPDDRFRSRLANELQRTPMPPAQSTIQRIIPYIAIARGAEFVDFLIAAFGATEINRHTQDDSFHSTVRIGDSEIIIAGGEHAARAERKTTLHIIVDDCDTTYIQALAAGAVPIPGYPSEPADRPYGERSAFIDDPFGNRFYIGSRLPSHYLANGPTAVPYFHPPSSRNLLDFVIAAFGAEEIMCHQHEGRVMHAVARLGESYIELGDADRAPVSTYAYTQNVDELYARALTAGAISLAPPENRSYGDRTATIQDPAGNEWTLAQQIAS